MVWLVLALLAFCVVIAASPQGGIQAALASVWVVMGLFAAGAVIYAIGRAFTGG